MSWVLQRTDQGGGYVASRGGYTHRLQHARAYPTEAAADADRCPGNEVAVSVDRIMGADR